MITGQVRSPFRETPQANADESKRIILRTHQEIEELLSSSAKYTPETKCKLSISDHFVKTREIYYRVFSKVL